MFGCAASLRAAAAAVAVAVVVVVVEEFRALELELLSPALPAEVGGEEKE